MKREDLPDTFHEVHDEIEAARADDVTRAAEAWRERIPGKSDKEICHAIAVALQSGMVPPEQVDDSALDAWRVAAGKSPVPRGRP